MKVFWSWQSDRPKAITRDFVQSALNEALAAVADDLLLDPAERPELDHDTKGEAGLVEIVNAIFEKIRTCTVFVADVTPVAETGQGKKVPNPNVMIELGHALSVLGPKPLILVANTTYGGKPDELPFDLRHRRGAITFRLKTTDDEIQRQEVHAKLVADLTDALSTNLSAALKERDRGVEFQLFTAPSGDGSTWLAPGATIEHTDFFGGSIQRLITPLGETRSYLRAAPSGWHKSKPTRLQVKEAPPEYRLWPLGQLSSGDGGVNRLGCVSYATYRGESKTQTAAQWFDATGEVWSFDSGITDDIEGSRFLGHYRVLKDWDKMIRNVCGFYNHFGAKRPVRIEVGVAGLDAIRWAEPLNSGRNLALQNGVVSVLSSRDWGEQARLDFLTTSYNLLCSAFGRPTVSSQLVQRILQSLPD